MICPQCRKRISGSSMGFMADDVRSSHYSCEAIQRAQKELDGAMSLDVKSDKKLITVTQMIRTVVFCVVGFVIGSALHRCMS